MKHNICIIPARGGSKRIPEKNIKAFNGKPIIAYSIEAAIQSKCFERVIVSTDDSKIADIAREYGAEVPWLRSAETANDHAPIIDAIIEVLEQLEYKVKGYENLCCILPTAPFVSPKKIIESHTMLIQENYSAIFPVVEFSYPIHRALQMDDANKVSMITPENMFKRSQDLPKSYHDVGQYYWIKIAAAVQEKTFLVENCGGIAINPLESQDIDTLDDWALAEIKYQKYMQGDTTS